MQRPPRYEEEEGAEEEELGSRNTGSRSHGWACLTILSLASARAFIRSFMDFKVMPGALQVPTRAGFFILMRLSFAYLFHRVVLRVKYEMFEGLVEEVVPDEI